MSAVSENLSLQKIVKKHYMSLASGTECQVTYVWIDEAKENLKTKTRTLNNEPAGIEGMM